MGSQMKTINQVAKYVGIHPQQIYRATQIGKLKFKLYGRTKLIDPAEARKFKQSYIKRQEYLKAKRLGR
jgi:hypothetical protein